MKGQTAYEAILERRRQQAERAAPAVASKPQQATAPAMATATTATKRTGKGRK